MCGIAGKVNFAGPADSAAVHDMCAVMEHRGPDSRGVWEGEGASLGMQRLAIIDRAGGDQPIFNEDRTVLVVMNGEIYNFQQLRADLRARGHRFSTESDTEVLVHLYEDHQERLVEHLRGMFAFAIWDIGPRRLVLGRDRAGKKPLLYRRHGSRVWFASEMMALLQDPAIDRTPDPRAIAAYLAYQYVPHPRTAFAGIEKLPPASTLTLTADGAEEHRYWRLDYRDRATAKPDDLAVELRELIWDATRARLISEVPLGAFLSGGIDSTAVVAAMAEQSSEPVKTFSIGFTDTEFDELDHARTVAERFSTDHHEFVVEPKALEIMPKLARHYGEPFADPAAIPTFYLAELTSRHVTVALNGDGGDECFAGYRRYTANAAAARLDVLPGALRRTIASLAISLPHGPRNNSARARLARFAGGLGDEPAVRYARYMSALPSSSFDDVLQPDFQAALGGWSPDDVMVDAWSDATASSPVDRLMEVDVSTILPSDLLAKVDIAAMAHSVECRSPLLDHHVMEFAAGLPAGLKMRGGDGKRLLKTALRGIVPDAILDRPKMGFGVPLARWFRSELRDLPGELLLDPQSHCHTYVKPKAISRMLAQHQDRATDHSLALWVLVQLEMWHREVVEAARPDAFSAPENRRAHAVRSD